MDIEAQRSIVDAFARELSAVVERTTGESIQCRATGPQEIEGSEEWLTWRQEFAPGTIGPAWAVATAADAKSVGICMLSAAGIGAVEDRRAQATYLDLLSNTFSTFARPLAQRLGFAVACGAGREDVAPAGAFFAIELRWQDTMARILTRFDGAQSPTAETMPSNAATAAQSEPQPRNLDLLLDVELPVSISFGSAQLPLKDVVKLTTGSMIELNRALSEPVELIVNNKVIARGEVVVVDGNFGVRIQDVVSRQERLKTAM